MVCHKYISYFVVILALLVPSFALAEDCEDGDESPRCLFKIDEDGKLTTKSGDPERTFSIPPLKTGFILDLGVPDFLPYAALEIFDFEVFNTDFAVDIGGTTGRMFVSFDWELITLLKLGPTIWAGWNVPEEKMSFGVGFTILKL